MKIQRTILGDGIAGLNLTGEFDAFAANPFLEQVEAMVQSGALHVVVNPRLVLFINSTAIGSLIKARKRIRGLGGEMVIAQPSARVKDTLATLGLDKVIKSFDSEDSAVDYLVEAQGGAISVPSENTVLVKFAEPNKQAQYSALSGVGKMSSLEERGIHFHAPGDSGLFSAGTELKVKFRLPLFRRAYYFDLPCRVASSDSDEAGVKVFAEFGDIFEEDQRAISQFARDLRLLKEEIRHPDSD